jgi:hypothetical protein
MIAREEWNPTLQLPQPLEGFHDPLDLLGAFLVLSVAEAR